MSRATDAFSVLNLILYNSTVPNEVAMRCHLTKYLESVPNVIFYFYSYREIQDAEIEVDGQDIYILGKEAFVPNILQKTIAAIRYCVSTSISFDYLIRSNISTVINYQQFPANELVGRHYASTLLHTLSWMDPPSGITDDRLFGLRFASGTNIILSREATTYLSEHYTDIDYSLMDDVAIGELLSHSPYASHQLSNGMRYASDSSWPLTGFTYRHKTNDRMKDATAMGELLDALSRQ